MDDFLAGLGALALGSRLKRLSDQLMQDGMRVYEAQGLGFQPRWFPVCAYLQRHGPTSITALARGLGVSHPGINKIANELIEARIVTPYRDRGDKRKRVLALTSEGRSILSDLEGVWRQIRQALQGLVDEGGGDFIRSLTQLELVISRMSFYDRFAEQNGKPERRVVIRPFHTDYAAAFKSLNIAWISHYFQIEPADLRSLDDPRGYVVDPGGEIFFAVDEISSEVLGTCALLKIDLARAELAKMAVAESAKGEQLGWLLGRTVVEEATRRGFRVLFLESNRKLTPAITLYKKLGFKEKPFPTASDYSRADIYMELPLAPEQNETVKQP